MTVCRFSALNGISSSSSHHIARPVGGIEKHFSEHDFLWRRCHIIMLVGGALWDYGERHFQTSCFVARARLEVSSRNLWLLLLLWFVVIVLHLFPCDLWFRSRCGSFEKSSCQLELKTTEFVRGTSLETIERQTQPAELYQDLASCAEAHRERETSTVKKARTVFDLMACAALTPAGTRSVLPERDEEKTDLRHEAGVQKREENDDASTQNPVTEPQNEKITEDASDKTLKKMSELFGSVGNLGAKLEMKVKNLEDQMTDGFKTEGIQRKKDYHDLEENEEKFRSRDRQNGGRSQECRRRKNAGSE